MEWESFSNTMLRQIFHHKFCCKALQGEEIVIMLRQLHYYNINGILGKQIMAVCIELSCLRTGSSAKIL
jgi:hypothetical protein